MQREERGPTSARATGNKAEPPALAGAGTLVRRVRVLLPDVAILAFVLVATSPHPGAGRAHARVCAFTPAQGAQARPSAAPDKIGAAAAGLPLVVIRPTSQVPGVSGARALPCIGP